MRKSLLAAGALCAAVLVLVLLKLMNDMSSAMTEMTAHMATMSRDVAEIRANMGKMSDSMVRIEGSMQGMGKAITRGSEQFQQWNPADAMKQMVPGSPQRSR
jgi:methyl-accepting chemotaxis protein